MLVDLFARLLETPLGTATEPMTARDAIVVLGARLGPGDGLTPPLAERVATATQLYRRGAAPIIAVTGGVTGTARRAEADVIAEALVAAGIPAEALVIERVAQTTADNARLTAALLVPSGVRRVWIVTQPFHALRAVRRFHAAGLDAVAWHIADSVQYRDRRRAVRWLVREYAAWARELLRRDH